MLSGEKGDSRARSEREMDRVWLKALRDVSLYLDRFDGPRRSLAFRRKEAAARIFINPISYMCISSLLIVTNLYSLHGVVDYSLRGIRTGNLPLKSLAHFNKSDCTSPLVTATWSPRVYRERACILVHICIRERSKLNLANAVRRRRRIYWPLLLYRYDDWTRNKDRNKRFAFDPPNGSVTCKYHVWIVKRRISVQLIGTSLILQNGDNSSDGPYN